jgi:hypothetical protein
MPDYQRHIAGLFIQKLEKKTLREEVKEILNSDWIKEHNDKLEGYG